MMKWHLYFKNKYTLLLEKALLLDELMFIVTHKRLLRYHSDRAIMHNYAIHMRTAKPDGTGNENEEMCKQFNVNKFSYLIDGEQRFIKEFFYNWSFF